MCRLPGLGGLPLALRLSEGLGLSGTGTKASMIDRKDATNALPMRAELAPKHSGCSPAATHQAERGQDTAYGGGFHQLTLKARYTGLDACREALTASRLSCGMGIRSREHAGAKLLRFLASELARKGGVWHLLGLGSGTPNAASSEA